MGSIGVPELIIIFVLAAGAALYFLPTIVAVKRKKANVAAIAVVNILLGWSVVGWVVAFVWACSTQVVDSAAAGPPGAAILCAHCGKYNQPLTRFCGHCGAASV